MKNLYLEGSAKTPAVDFDVNTGVLVLRGRSIPENSIEFFRPIKEWLDVYGIEPRIATRVEVRLEYFNTSSSKCILDLFKRLERMNVGPTEVLINWYFEKDDEDMEEAGEDFKSIVKLPFEIIEVDEI